MINKIKAYLEESCPWQDSLLWFPSIESTNTAAKDLARQGAPAGTVLIADTQTGGRGRRGRSFHSPAASGIYMSVILRPACAPTELMHLTCATAVAICDALESVCGFRPGIKWTNDLVWGKRKLGGILTELGLTPSGQVDYAVVGIGINCSQQEFPPEIRDIAGSIASVTGKEIPRAQIAAAMIQALWFMDQALLPDRDKILEHYRRDCVTLGKEISLIKADGIVRHGTALDIDCDGGLVVRFADNSIEIVNSGEVSIRGMYGYV